MTEIESRPNPYEAGVIKGVIRLHCWTGAWVFSICMLGIGSKHIWNFNTTVTVLMVLINAAIGIGMILAHIRYLKGQDEMQQRILLESAALTLGITLVFGGSFQLWGDIQLISFEPRIWHVISLMGLAHIVTTLNAIRRYQ